MWPCFHQRRLTVIRYRCGAIAFALLVTFTPALLGAFVPDARAEVEQLSKAGQAGQPVLVREHAGWNRNCEAIAHPVLILSEPPRHGKVCARFENIKISSMFVGTEAQCIGRLVRGVRLVYRPDSAYVGDDSLQYSAQYPSVLRTIQVQVTVTAGISSAIPSTIIMPVEQVRQEPGRVPDCVEQIF